MNKTGADVLGNALRDYLNGKPDGLIKVHSDIAEWEEMAVAHFFRSFSGMTALEQKALALCRGSVADLGAGAGSHALELQNRQLPVTAIDISKGACAVMAHRGVQQVIQGDIFSLNNATYDTVLMLMNGIGLVGDLDGLSYFLQTIKKHLKPGGQIIADSSDISYMFYDEDGFLTLNLNAEYHGVVNYQMEYKNQKGKPFKWLFIDFPLLQDYAAAHGFNCSFIQEDHHYNFLAILTLKN
jgi:SAM-dependent methyltransferase